MRSKLHRGRTGTVKNIVFFVKIMLNRNERTTKRLAAPLFLYFRGQLLCGAIVETAKRSNRLVSKHAVTSVTLLGTTVTGRPFTLIAAHPFSKVNIENNP